ncbi:hypothetical protein BN2476_1020014 [Paraburkholderia piptadeniae]|uniref:Uncharacterized protein n=1 Tax=Paraburkholderia piptadeniae TaxID=1701573 RepID=A0A1N7SUX5_9BURK|nr:hypothetical protein BN2476_1020014 [Paraburkholderia piptadeniae]
MNARPVCKFLVVGRSVITVLTKDGWSGGHHEKPGPAYHESIAGIGNHHICQNGIRKYGSARQKHPRA